MTNPRDELIATLRRHAGDICYYAPNDPLMRLFDAAADELERLQHEVLELKAALFFWMPEVPALDPEIAERTGHDSFLLIDAECDMRSAQDLGWIILRRPPDEPPAPTA